MCSTPSSILIKINAKMNSFTPAIRSSLLQSAKQGDTLRRWSIRELLKLNEINATNAKVVLSELRTRLAIQHQRLSSSRLDDYAKIASIAESATVVKSMKMLSQLHENTYILPHEIIENREFLESFSSRPNQIYLKEMIDQIMTRHGASVDTFADATIAARSLEKHLPHILRSQFRKDFATLYKPEQFLHSRLLIQLMCEHYVSLNKGKPFGALSIDAL